MERGPYAPPETGCFNVHALRMPSFISINFRSSEISNKLWMKINWSKMRYLMNRSQQLMGKRRLSWRLYRRSG
jgi:hypothetical protein